MDAIDRDRAGQSDPGGARSSGGAPGTVVERVLDSLRAGILHRRFAPGQRLVEADLTRDLGVSRGPLREAFRRLAAEGLIEIAPHRGAMVRRLSRREMVELFQIRTELEALGARLAAERIANPSVRARFEAATRPIWSDAPRHQADYTDENSAFHLAVIEAGGNGQLDVLSRQLQLPLIMLQVRGGLEPGILARSVTEHRRIASAILDGDPASAARQMRAHLQDAARLAGEMLQD